MAKIGDRVKCVWDDKNEGYVVDKKAVGFTWYVKVEYVGDKKHSEWIENEDVVRIKEETMKEDVVTTTRERVLEAAGKCSVAKDALKTLFPDVFKDEWVDITNVVRAVMEEGGFWFARIYYNGEKIGNFAEDGVVFGNKEKYRAKFDGLAIKIERKG